MVDLVQEVKKEKKIEEEIEILSIIVPIVEKEVEVAVIVVKEVGVEIKKDLIAKPVEALVKIEIYLLHHLLKK